MSNFTLLGLIWGFLAESEFETLLVLVVFMFLDFPSSFPEALIDDDLMFESFFFDGEVLFFKEALDVFFFTVDFFGEVELFILVEFAFPLGSCTYFLF